MATEIKSLGERIDIRLTKIETRMDDWDKRFCNIEEKLTKCIEFQQATEKLASCNSLKVNELEARVEFFETRLREPNLVFYGFEREGDENQADCNLKIQNIIRDKMEIGDDLKITKCHRLSRGSNAPVLVVVPDYADRAKIFKNAYKLRDTKISISKDYSKNVREQRRILIAKRKELGERGIKSKLRDNKLFVNDKGSLQILLDFKVDDQLYSDHHPLVLTIKGQNFNEKKKKNKREDYNITRYRWSADGLAMFKMKLEELREKNIPASDDLVYTFNQRILEAMSSAKITYSIKGGPRKSKPWFDKDCYDMKKLAKESLKKYRKTNRLEDRECYASSRKKYLALLDLKRKGFDNEKQEILRNAKDSKTFWKTIALYKSTSIIQGEISIKDWLNFYRELMTTEKNLRICNLHNVISQNDPLLDSEITNADIYKEIVGLRSNKACGPDGIPNEVLKTLPDSYILLLKQLYNSVMTTGKYPAIWTNSTIHPIFKNGYKNSPSNYREFGDIHLLLYADDIAIIGESRMNLQKKIKILKEYLDENLITLNESKSKIMVFRNGGKPSNKDRWFWNDKPITITSRYTYLGFPLTPTITTTHPANYFKGKALTAINATHPILIKSKAKSINLSTKLFDTIVRAVLMYAAPLWATEHKYLLDSIQDIFIRRFLNLPRYTPGYLIRLETGRISLSVTALKLTLKYWLRVLNMSSDRLPRICFNRTRELSNASVGARFCNHTPTEGGGNRKNEARRGWQHGPGMQRRETICFRCGEKNSHLAPACPHKTKSCFKCKRIGHLSRVCKTGKSLPDCSYVQDEFIYSVQGDTDAKMNLHVDEYQLCFVVDTGSPVTLIPKTIYEKYWKDNKLSPSYLRLRSFCGKPMKIIGERRVFVKEANQDLRLIVVDKDISIVLLGREWLKGLNLDFSRLLNIRQVRLSEEAKRVVNINTTKGLFAFKRLPYGVAVAPNKFQREMDNLFADMSGVACYIDDILVAGKDHRDHEQKLELVFKRLQEKGLRLNKDKCKFAVNAVEYLGFKIDKKGLHPISSKIEAVVEAPEPTNVSQLRSFIGLLMYYSRFIRNIADILAPSYHLLKKNSKWNWTSEHRILFAKCKALLTKESVLAHYDATRELVLACDASSYGLGVVLSHRNDRKEETPIAFASRTLTEAERRYSQLEKEALSIIFGCEKFRQYLLGREFVLITDNRPLMHIFSPQKPIPICAASRIKRWSLKLSAFKYTVEFRKTDDNGNADALSRLPLVSKTTESLDEDQVLLLRKMSEVPFSFQDVAVETRRDKLLSIVLRNVRENNWQIPKVSQENPLYSYYKIKDELSCEFGCLQWRERVVIPQKLRSLILNDLHEMHLGMVKMKMIARRYFWWPGIDKNIEELARDCRICQESASMPPSTISEWTWPEKPWHRLHLDLAGPFMGRMFMVLVDAHTKWLEIVIIKDITSRTIIGHLREIFARFGLPELLVTDNGRQFDLSEFEEFTKINGIRHTKTSPYNPSTNGLAERYVREFKNSLRKNQGKDSIEINLQRFLFTHRPFPQTVLKESLAELLMKRSLRSRFSNLIPKMAKVGEVYHDAMRKQEHFAVGSDVYFRSFANGPKWKRGRVMELLSSRHYLIEDEGRYVKRHINQLRPVIKKEVPEVRDLVLPGTSRDFILPGTSRDHPRLGGQEKTMEEAPEVDEELKGAESSAQEDTPEPEPGPAAAAVPVPVRSPRPQRSRRPPDRLHYY
ncbi:K02A2.6-like [Cordylochernes scorpioides]|uniref:RNA-directed DNA polymerase n=1 Tax=Cordylochernes scorpioides TaxID=51811 RepID=A0ABY6KNF2_9ARAC|nr:K02A2.6-like [Cordylochernes scorpioides]